MKIIILAGGRGTRLWPLSQSSFPKQLLDFGDSYSLLQKTILRFLSVYDPSSLLVVTNKECERLVQKQCLEVEEKGEITVLVEPCSRSTAPALSLAVRFLEENKRLQPGECVLVAPSDCLFSSDESFLSSLALAENSAKNGFLTLFGVTPSKAETGYGYLLLGSFKEGGFAVDQFIEKPIKEKAEQLISLGDVLWNIGHLLFLPEVFWEEMKKHAKEIASLETLSFQDSLKKMEELPSISLDYALLEKSKILSVFPVTSSWLDVGSWDSVYESLEKDENGNVKRGHVLEVDSKNCLFLGGKRPLSAISLEDLLVIDTEEALLLVKRGSSQKVKQPFSSEETSYKVQKKIVHPGQSIDLLKGRLVVLKGKAKVFFGDEVHVLQENDTFFQKSPLGFLVENGGEDLLEILEVQTERECFTC